MLKQRETTNTIDILIFIAVRASQPPGVYRYCRIGVNKLYSPVFFNGRLILKLWVYTLLQVLM
jgi:hypothetical protein